MKKKEKQSKKQNQQDKGQSSASGLHNGIQPGISFESLNDQEQEGEDIDISAWNPLDLSPEVQTSLSKLKFANPTPIQLSCIPEILAGHDVIGKASTGSGKTLAFGIPILEHYLETRGNNTEDSKTASASEDHPIALILSPTRELAHQLAKHLADLNTNAPSTNARIALLTGGLSVQKQQRRLANADIVIGTPGRLWEILSEGQGLIAKMKKIRYLVIDEADRLLLEGHFKELEQILKALDREDINDDLPDQSDSESSDVENEKSQRQTLVFSATFHKGLQQKLAGKNESLGGDTLDKNESMEYLLKKLSFREEKPKFIDVNPSSQMAEKLKEGLVECGAMEKVGFHSVKNICISVANSNQDLYLYTLLLYHPKHRTLVFTNSISGVRRLTPFLQNLDLPAISLHSSMAQKARLRSVERFSSPPTGKGTILVATDVAARGLDVKNIDLIIHYHVPRTADAYVHRSGRTARAETSGKSVLLCSPDEVRGVTRLVAKVHANHGKKKQTNKVRGLALESVELDRRLITRIRPRVTLSKKITESLLAKEKISAEDDWLRSAAEDLGVDYDSEEFAVQGKSSGRGRGGGRQQKEKEASSLSKAEIGALRAELKQLLKKRINVGVSETYLTSGKVDIDALLKGEGDQEFLGQVDALNF